MNELYNTIGISKQAVIQYQKRQLIFDDKILILLKGSKRNIKNLNKIY